MEGKKKRGRQVAAAGLSLLVNMVHSRDHVHFFFVSSGPLVADGLLYVSFEYLGWGGVGGVNSDLNGWRNRRETVEEPPINDEVELRYNNKKRKNKGPT